MDKTLLRGLVLIFLCFAGQVTYGQDLIFNVIAGNTSCDNSNHCVDIQVTGFVDISAFQFAIQYDESLLTHTSTNSTLPQTWIAGNPNNGQVNFSWSNFQGVTIPDNDPIITVCFQATGQIGTTAVGLGDSPSTPVQAINTSFNVFVLNSDLFLNQGIFDINDNTAPTITCPTDTVITSVGATAINNIAPVAMDNCQISSINYTLSGSTTGTGNTDASGTVFNPGTTTVAYTVMDDAGNMDNCSFEVTVNLMPPPTDTIFTFTPHISLNCVSGLVEMCLTVRNADNIEALQVPYSWNELQLGYVSSSISLPPNGIIADGNSVNGVAALIWNQTGLPNGLTLTDGDTLFCSLFNVLAPVDTALFSIEDLPLINIEVVSVESGTAMPIPFNIDDEIIIAQDNTPPVFANCPSDTMIVATAGTCGMNYTWTSPTATDECVANIQIDSTHASGDFFGIGTTTVTYTATDLAGNIGTCSFDVIIVDNEIPTLSCPTDTALMTTGPVVVNDIDAVASDLCGSVSISYTLTNATTGSGSGTASGSSFETGMTTVTYTATDSSGNINTCSFIVTVSPGALPEINCPNDTIVSNDLGECAAIVNDIGVILISNPINIDSIHYLLSGATTGSGSANASGTSFNVGVTTVTYIATDLSGQTDSCNFTVSVNDTEDPTAVCPPLDAFPNTPGQCGTVVNNNLFPTTTDNCSVTSVTYVFTGATSGSGSNDPTGSFFNVGITSVDYTISDAAGNTTSCSVQVWVNDMDAPTITCPSDTIVSIPFGVGSAIVGDIDPATISDNCPDPAITYAINGATTNTGMGSASGASFNVGINTVTYYVTDSNGNIDSCMFNVTLENMPLGDLLDCPNDTVVNTDLGVCGAIVNDIAPILLVDASLIQSITYLIDGATMATDTMDASGTFFNTPISTIKYLIEDINGNQDSCTFTVTVIDNEAPIWTGCPDTIPVYVDNLSCREIASWNIPLPSDNCGVQNILNSHMPGDTFDLGFTTVTYTAIDNAMNNGLCEFVIWVQDTLPPVFTCPSDTVISAITDCSIAVSWIENTPTDNCSIADFSSTHNSGDLFNLGVTTVGYSVQDGSGNQTQCSFTITVLDGVAPIIDCPAEIIVRADGTIVSDPTGLITSLNTMIDCDSLEINFDNPSANDACEGDLPTVLYDGLPSGSAFPIGNATQSFRTEDINGNADTCIFDIIVLPLEAVQAEVIGSGIICAGEDATFNIVNPIAGAIYNWAGPDGFTATGTNPVVNNATIDNTGIYGVICIIPGGCTSQGTVSLTVMENPDFEVVSNSPLCSDGSGDLLLVANLNAGSPTVDVWSWTGPNAFTSSDQNPVIFGAGSNTTGTYSVIATASNGCTASATTEVVVGEVATPNVNSDCNGVICIGESCILLGTEYPSIADEYFWTSGDSSGLPMDVNNNSIEVTPTEAGIYIYNYSVSLNGCLSEIATFALTVMDAPIAENDDFTTSRNISLTNISMIDNDQFNSDLGISVDLIEGTENGNITVNNDGTFTYIPNEGFIGEDMFTYEICNNCSELLCDQATVTIDVQFDGDECEIPTVITPNGDLKNEFLVIDCLSTGDFPNNSITIYGQWGDQVFKAAPYNNNWDGTYENQPLPDGTYYYLFDDGRGGEVVKGSLTLFR